MIEIWIYILTPLVLYLGAFLMEAYMSVKRLGNHKGSGSYLDATWETTHTFLVVTVALFVAFFSQNLVDIAKASWLGLWVAAVGIGLRGAAYIYIFYVRRNQAVRSWVDYFFAGIHVLIVAGVGILLMQLVPVLFTIDLKPNTEFIPYMWPGLIFILVLCVPPLLSLYRSPRR
jgi:cytochrome bd-type quinol oxidase subunit 2